MTAKKITPFFLILFIFCFYSCGPRVPVQTTIPVGVIATEGVTITAQDGSFELTQGEMWNPPYQNDATGHNFNKEQTNVLDAYKLAYYYMGAQKVRVKTPYIEKDLFGLLLLAKVPYGCDDPTTRSYQISVPRNYVQDALGGRISVVYEYYGPCGPYYRNVDDFQGKTWVLWLSDIPFSF